MEFEGVLYSWDENIGEWRWWDCVGYVCQFCFWFRENSDSEEREIEGTCEWESGWGIDREEREIGVRLW